MYDCYALNARLTRPYVHPINVADFKGIRAGQPDSIFGRDNR